MKFIFILFALCACSRVTYYEAGKEKCEDLFTRDNILKGWRCSKVEEK